MPIKAREYFVRAGQNERYRTAHAELATNLILARNVLRYRAAAGVSQQELASLAGMKQPRIAELEGGYGNPTLETLNKLAQAMNTTPDRLIRADDGRSGTPQVRKIITKRSDRYSVGDASDAEVFDSVTEVSMRVQFPDVR